MRYLKNKLHPIANTIGIFRKILAVAKAVINITFFTNRVSALFGHRFSTFENYFLWLRITDEGSVPEMRIWSIL